MGNYSDDLIVRTLREKDSRDCNDVFKFMYKDFFPVINKFVVSNNGNETEARDIFQETIIAFYEKMKDEDFVLNCSVKTYLYSISRNLWLKRLSKVKRFVESVNDFEDFVNTDETEDESSDGNDTLMDLINKLDEGCKQILVYYYYEKLKMKTIMDKMNLKSEQSTKNKKCKCMKHLMEIIKENKNTSALLKEKYFE